MYKIQFVNMQTSESMDSYTQNKLKSLARKYNDIISS